MTKLFIIGNGFDRAHRLLNTLYEDFHQYLVDNYPKASDERTFAYYARWKSRIQ